MWGIVLTIGKNNVGDRRHHRSGWNASIHRVGDCELLST